MSVLLKDHDVTIKDTMHEETSMAQTSREGKLKKYEAFGSYSKFYTFEGHASTLVRVWDPFLLGIRVKPILLLQYYQYLLCCCCIRVAGINTYNRWYGRGAQTQTK